MNDSLATNITIFPSVSYSTDPLSKNLKYTLITQIYYILCGTTTISLNLYLILLFVKFHNLRTKQCNWLIIFQCIDEVLIGFGTFMRAVTYLIADSNDIFVFGLTFCTFVGGASAIGYRTGQTIALLIALDRFLAIWKSTYYARRQGKVGVFLFSTILKNIFSCQ